MENPAPNDHPEPSSPSADRVTAWAVQAQILARPMPVPEESGAQSPSKPGQLLHADERPPSASFVASLAPAILQTQRRHDICRSYSQPAMDLSLRHVVSPRQAANFLGRRAREYSFLTGSPRNTGSMGASRRWVMPLMPPFIGKALPNNETS